jgi:cellulose synthase/poly-beta-1,6-N-acetylglucosamine synthase-like glycosyltransferase
MASALQSPSGRTACRNEKTDVRGDGAQSVDGHTSKRALVVTASRVTILVTSHNQREYLAESVASALAQTVPCEVIVVDDGSTDGSAELAEQLGVPTVRLPHQGALNAFRSGVRLVESEFYVLLNADDVLEPDFVEATLPAMSDPNVGVVYTGWRYIGAQRGVVPAKPFDARELLFGNYIPATSLTRKIAHDSVGGFSDRFADFLEDWALWVSMSKKGWRFVAIDRPLLRYRRHPAPSRNTKSNWAHERARWRMALAHPTWYGVSGYVRLAGSWGRLVVERAFAVVRGRRA